MMGSLYIGATGMKTHSQGLNVVGNNLANVSTVGYKQQSIVFQDLMSQDLPIGSTGGQGFNQLGMGATVGSVRTLFTEGNYEPGSSMTDLAISGKGFFQVSDTEETHYTRAGNFRFSPDGWLRDPSGFTLSGAKVVGGVPSDEVEPIHIDFKAEGIATSAARATSLFNARVNIGDTADTTSDAVNPYFSLQQKWNGTATPPLPASDYNASVPFSVYDSNGDMHEMTVYFDGAPSAGGERLFEYVVAMKPSEDASAAAGSQAAGLLMSGTLSFSGSGVIEDMTAFTPNSPGSLDLATWTPANIANGMPQILAQFAAAPGSKDPAPTPQRIGLNLGVTASSNTWTNAPTSAAAIGIDHALIPSMENPVRNEFASTSYVGTSNLATSSQDGLGVGFLRDMTVTSNGRIQAQYSNGESVDLYSIPLFRFTSEDNLKREGMNHYSAPEEVGNIEGGEAGTSNYGKIESSKLELSNVDMSREMVNMITVQRGFQMNSKSVTTADTMLQKALELKRN